MRASATRRTGQTNMTPRISIAMCTYNGARFVREQLDSIAQQTLLPDELVICDDGSQDETVAICRDFAASAPFSVRIYENQANLGVTKNFEKAIGLCTGDWIALCDQDDVWCPPKLQRIDETFKRFPDLGAVFTDAELVDEALRPMNLLLWNKSTTFFPESGRRRVRKGELLDVLLRHNVVTGATMAFMSGFRDMVIPVPTGWDHDNWIAIIVAVFGRVGMVERPLIKYRQHTDNQIGAQRLTFPGKVSAALRASPLAYVHHGDHYAALRERVLKLGPGLDVAGSLAKIEKKLSHLDNRAHLPAGVYKRLRAVTKELCNLNYHHFSKGFYSAAVDLFFKERNYE
jgi:glycosyltransferase involved in cell wall biosynthesis